MWKNIAALIKIIYIGCAEKYLWGQTMEINLLLTYPQQKRPWLHIRLLLSASKDYNRPWLKDYTRPWLHIWLLLSASKDYTRPWLHIRLLLSVSKDYTRPWLHIRLLLSASRDYTRPWLHIRLLLSASKDYSSFDLLFSFVDNKNIDVHDPFLE
jgi:hypothetical protein